MQKEPFIVQYITQSWPAGVIKKTSENYTVSGKKRTNSVLGITSSNTGRFPKFFQCRNLLEIRNKTLLNFPPHLKRVATLPCDKLMSEN